MGLAGAASHFLLQTWKQLPPNLSSFHTVAASASGPHAAILPRRLAGTMEVVGES